MCYIFYELQIHNIDYYITNNFCSDIKMELLRFKPSGEDPINMIICVVKKLEELQNNIDWRGQFPFQFTGLLVIIILLIYLMIFFSFFQGTSDTVP